ncbi:response regulator transcription factor [Herpetosiphon gulosus]|uniref:KDP operon transcriptional regulatory protein KdpE n=1 Tax=Herpetosiphon gulosus TaxID=1973496 RepID=A0ABP9WYI4_9CHLR
MATQPVRVLLAEDEDVLRDFIRRNLQVRGFEVLEATNGLEALALWHTEQPQLIILDLMMPRLTGFEVCQRIREQSIVPIIVLTALDAERDKVMAFDLGADDYLCKPFGVDELLARIRAVLRRSQWSVQPQANGIKRYGELEIDLEAHSVRRAGLDVRLTPTEFALLAYLSTHPNKVLTHRMLLQHVWGDQYRDEAEYLRVYIGRLRRKLEADPSNPRHLLTEAGIGYRFVG